MKRGAPEHSRSSEPEEKEKSSESSREKRRRGFSEVSEEPEGSVESEISEESEILEDSDSDSYFAAHWDLRFIPEDAEEESSDMEYLDDEGDYLPGRRATTRPPPVAAPLPARTLSDSSKLILPTAGLDNGDFVRSPSKSRFLALYTPIQPRDADHSFNGIISFIENKGPEFIIVHGFKVSGTLGPTKIFVHQKSNVGIRESTEEGVWEEIFSGNVSGPSVLVDSVVIRLTTPFIVEPGTQRGFYIHVSVFHDEGLIYQSFRDPLIVGDKRIRLLAGAGRCGDRPFEGGWWRGGRGLSGTVLYEAIKKVWSPQNHHEFPPSFRRIVLTLLMIWYRPDNLFHSLPAETLFSIIEEFDYDWFEETQPQGQALETPYFLRRSLDRVLAAFQ